MSHLNEAQKESMMNTSWGFVRARSVTFL